MKILFPVEVFYPSQAGGPANSVYWLTKHLKLHGIDNTIVATDKGLQPGEPRNRWVRNAAGDTIYIKARNLSVPLRQTLTALRQVSKTDVVHLSSVFFPSAFFTGVAARLLGKKIICSVRGELDPVALTYSTFRKRPFLWIMRNWLAPKTIFHSTCDEETSYIKNALGPRTTVVQIPNFIEIPSLEERIADNYFLLVGRVHKKKGIENLLSALASNEEFRASNYLLKIAGKGTPEYERGLHKMVADLELGQKVQFLGQVEGVEKQRLYANAFWTIMPSHTENFGLVVLESLAQNTPVIASKGSPWEVLEKEKLGFWVDNSSEPLSRAITVVMRMPPGEYENYRKRGRTFVERNYDISQNVERWIELYRSLTAENR